MCAAESSDFQRDRRKLKGKKNLAVFSSATGWDILAAG
jgi:hypothetical protein